MSVDYHAIAFSGFALTIVAVIITEFWPGPRLARAAARSAIALSLLSGAVWSYAIYLKGYVFTPYEAQHFARRSGGTATYYDGAGGGGGAVRIVGRGGNSQSSPEDAAGSGASDAGFGSVIVVASRRVSNDVGDALESVLPGRGGARRERADKDVDGELKRDCEGCPEMVVIAGGAVMIGAPDTDQNASAAEKPQRMARIWPGFAISRRPILVEEYDAFRKDAGLAARACAGLEPEVLRLARCITASEAEQYAAWLSSRTGLSFRVPTAIEWEFAARMRGMTIVASIEAPADAAPLLGGIGREIAEMTSECYDPFIPSQGLERYASSARPWLCEERVLKGARPGEDEVFKRFSARRPWHQDSADAGVGFRVMRDLR